MVALHPYNLVFRTYLAASSTTTREATSVELFLILTKFCNNISSDQINKFLVFTLKLASLTFLFVSKLWLGTMQPAQTL